MFAAVTALPLPPPRDVKVRVIEGEVEAFVAAEARRRAFAVSAGLAVVTVIGAVIAAC